MLPPQAEFVFNDPAPFDTPKHMLNPYADGCQPPVLGFLVWRECATAWLFLRLRDRTPGNGKALKAQVLIQDGVGWKAIVFLVGHRCIVPPALIRAAEKAHAAIVGNQQQIFERMLVLLPAVVEALFIRV